MNGYLALLFSGWILLWAAIAGGCKNAGGFATVTLVIIGVILSVGWAMMIVLDIRELN